MTKRIPLPEPVARSTRRPPHWRLYIRPQSSLRTYATCDRLVVLRVVSPEEAEIVYDGPGQPVWEKAGQMGKNGQRVVSLSRLRAIADDGSSLNLRLRHF